MADFSKFISEQNNLNSKLTQFKDVDPEITKKMDPFEKLFLDPNRKIKVLLVATRLTIGGDTNVILDIASYLHNHPQVEVNLAAGPVPPQEVDLTYLANERGIPFIIIPSMVTYINLWRNFRSFIQLYSQIRREQYDIVHTNNAIAGAIGRSTRRKTRRSGGREMGARSFQCARLQRVRGRNDPKRIVGCLMSIASLSNATQKKH